MNSVFLMTAVLAAGATVALQSPINAGLGRTLQSPYAATFISFLGGLIAAAVVLMALGHGQRLTQLSAARPWQLLGGPLGMLFVVALTIAVPRLGVSSALVIAVAGQLVAAMVIDHFGLLGLPERPIGWSKLLALPMMATAVWLIRR